VILTPFVGWEAGALFQTLIDYWVETGDDTYNAVTTQGLLHQVGTSNDFLPANQSLSEGNDDQGVWALAAIAAAENALPGGQPQWLDLAKNVFTEFVSRWDTKNCGGGLRWQIAAFNNGYDYKNSVSNAVFFDLSARLFRQTNNETYSQWASKVFEWEQTAGFISDSYQVFQGAQVEACSDINKAQSSMDAGIFLHGSAVMYNTTTSSDWKTRVDGLLKNVQATFVKDGVLYESMCEGQKTCTTDMQSYKSFLIRSLKATTQVAPYTDATIQPLLQTTAKVAAKACTGSPSSGFSGQSGTACGFTWVGGSGFDGLTGIGEQLNALSAVMSTLSYSKSQSAPSPGSNTTSSSGSGQPSGTSGTSKPSTTPKSSGNIIAVNAAMALVVMGSVVYGLC
jgi:mannan endo-1,6-alpha-mannosidase